MAIVLYLNDFADEETDKINQTYYISGGSRVISQGKISARQLLLGALGLSVADIAFLVGVSDPWGRIWLPLLGLLGFACGWLYSMQYAHHSSSPSEGSAHVLKDCPWAWDWCCP